jgi:hypothetical protein
MKLVDESGSGVFEVRWGRRCCFHGAMVRVDKHWSPPSEAEGQPRAWILSLSIRANWKGFLALSVPGIMSYASSNRRTW